MNFLSVVEEENLVRIQPCVCLIIHLFFHFSFNCLLWSCLERTLSIVEQPLQEWRLVTLVQISSFICIIFSALSDHCYIIYASLISLTLLIVVCQFLHLCLWSLVFKHFFIEKFPFSTTFGMRNPNFLDSLLTDFITIQSTLLARHQ